MRREAKDFFPYGQQRTVTPVETEKYATYMHDGRTDLTYTDQRCHSGRLFPVDEGNWITDDDKIPPGT